MQSHYSPLTTLLKEKALMVKLFMIFRGQTTGHRIILFHNVHIIAPTKLFRWPF